MDKQRNLLIEDIFAENLFFADSTVYSACLNSTKIVNF